MSTIYIHWPYCISKCYYCDFNSIACTQQIDYKYYLKLYKNILRKFHFQFYKNEQITSIYFGGGTPSLLSVEFIENILEFINKNFKLAQDIEITLEANPKTIDKEKATKFKNSGINRLSIGMQSLDDASLKTLGRSHNAYDALTCVYDMSTIFSNISIDLIYNRPNQILQEWEIELQQALKLPIQHISMYELIIEENTYMKYLIDNGILQAPSDSSKFYEKTVQIAELNKFEQYEVSNYAKNKLYSKHNLSYWKYDDYYGVGPGSHSRVFQDNHKIAIEQIANIKEWLIWAQNPTFKTEILSENDEFTERVIMGLRTKFGLNINNIPSNVMKRVYTLVNTKNAIIKNNYLILTKLGLLRLNLIEKFLLY